MDELLTKVCDRCEKEFEIDLHYRTLFVENHPHPKDVEMGAVEDLREYVLCLSCSLLIPAFLDPEVDSLENYSPSAELREALEDDDMEN